MSLAAICGSGFRVLLLTAEFWGVLLPRLPRMKWGRGEILRRFGSLTLGQLRTWHCSEAMERQKKAILKRQSAPKASGHSQALLRGAGIEGKRRQLIKALLAQELLSAN